MSYSLKKGEELGDGVARIIRVQRDRIRDSVGASSDADPNEFIRKTRVRCKRIRAAMRLARPVMDKAAYESANLWWRDANRRLAALRDAQARIDLLEHLKPELSEGARIEAGRVLDWMRAAAPSQHGDNEAVWSAIAAWLRDLDDAELDIPNAEHLPSEAAMEQALEISYRAVRKDMKIARRTGATADLHEWRKAVKILMLELRLVRKIRPEPALLAEPLEALALKLGEVQDMELALAAIAMAGEERGPDAYAGLRSELAELQKRAEAEALAMGERLFRGKLWSPACVEVRPDKAA